MNEINMVKVFCGILMAAGMFVFVDMLADLLSKAILIGADALDAAIRQREKKDPRLLLYSEISGGIHVLHGTALPMAVALVISVMVIRLNPVKESVVPVFMFLLWGTAAACLSNIRYFISCNVHAALFTNKFYAAYVSLQNLEKAFDEACASIPGGIIKSRCISAGKQLARGMKWNDAVNELDDGTTCGKGLSIYLKLFEKNQSDPDESVASYYYKIFSGDARIIRNRMSAMKNAGLMLGIALLVYSAVVVYFQSSAWMPVSAAVFLSTGILLALMMISFRNMCIEGNLV